jgi:hypothetical protein
MAMWRDRRQASGLTPKPLIPTGQAYREGLRQTRYIPPEEVAEFLRCTSQYCKGANLWQWELMDEEQWRMLRDAPGGLTDQEQKYARSPGLSLIALR